MPSPLAALATQTLTEALSFFFQGWRPDIYAHAPTPVLRGREAVHNGDDAADSFLASTCHNAEEEEKEEARRAAHIKTLQAENPLAVVIACHGGACLLLSTHVDLSQGMSIYGNNSL